MLRLSVLDQSPVRSGRTPAEAIQETFVWPRPSIVSATTATGSPSTTPAQRSRRRPGDPDRPGRGAHAPHARRLRRRDALPLQRAQGGREVPPARDAVPRAHRPGHRPRAGQRPPHGAALGRARSAADGPAGAGRSEVEQFPDQLADLLGFLPTGCEPEHPFAPVRAMPAGTGAPEMWLLGSTDGAPPTPPTSARGSPSPNSSTPDGGAAVTRAYARAFRPSPELAEPRASVGVFVVCADTEAEAVRLARSRDLFVVRLDSDAAAPYPRSRRPSAPLHAARASHRRARAQRTIAGAPEQVRDRLLALAAEYGVDELVVVTITQDPRRGCARTSSWPRRSGFRVPARDRDRRRPAIRSGSGAGQTEAAERRVDRPGVGERRPVEDRGRILDVVGAAHPDQHRAHAGVLPTTQRAFCESAPRRSPGRPGSSDGRHGAALPLAPTGRVGAKRTRGDGRGPAGSGPGIRASAPRTRQ